MVSLGPFSRIVNVSWNSFQPSLSFQFYWVGSNPAMTGCSPGTPLEDMPWRYPTADPTVFDGMSPLFFGTTYELLPHPDNYFLGDATGSGGPPEGFSIGGGMPDYTGIISQPDNHVFSQNTRTSYDDPDLFFSYETRHTRIIADQDAKTATYVMRMPNHRGFLYCDGGLRWRPWDKRGYGYEWGDYDDWAQVDDLYNFVAFEKTLDCSGLTLIRDADGVVFVVDSIGIDTASCPLSGNASFTCFFKRSP